MTINFQEIPRTNCFDGPRVSFDDICGKSNKCKTEDCLWHKKKGKISPTLGTDNNRTEAMPKIR
jgi:hypothetical protein